MPLIYLVAGEASGDVLGARLMAALANATSQNSPSPAIGGEQMAAQGLASLFPMQDLALMGLLEVLPRLRHLRRRLHQTVADIAARRPDVVVTIDSPGFTLRLLKAIQPLGVKRVHYVAPQVWAWREGRVRHYPGLWDQLLCLLPFEPAFFARHDLPATFVGHPVLESGADRGDAARFRAIARHRSGGARPDADAGQPSHRGGAAAADPRRHIAASAGCRAGGAGGRAGRAMPCAAGRAQLAAAAGAGHGARRTSTTPSPPPLPH